MWCGVVQFGVLWCEGSSGVTLTLQFFGQTTLGRPPPKRHRSRVLSACTSDRPPNAMSKNTVLSGLLAEIYT